MDSLTLLQKIEKDFTLDAILAMRQFEINCDFNREIKTMRRWGRDAKLIQFYLPHPIWHNRQYLFVWIKETTKVSNREIVKEYSFRLEVEDAEQLREQFFVPDVKTVSKQIEKDMREQLKNLLSFYHPETYLALEIALTRCYNKVDFSHFYGWVVDPSRQKEIIVPQFESPLNLEQIKWISLEE